MDVQICKICNNEYKNLTAHVSKGHNMTMDEYDSVEVVENIENILKENIIENDKQTDPDTVKRNMFNLDSNDISLKDKKGLLKIQLDQPDHQDQSQSHILGTQILHVKVAVKYPIKTHTGRSLTK